jgi:hypothetical protein
VRTLPQHLHREGLIEVDRWYTGDEERFDAKSLLDLIQSNIALWLRRDGFNTIQSGLGCKRQKWSPAYQSAITVPA